MTFGGLALGVGMIVDAAIVVLENSFRHMEEHGKDRLTAAIDGSEEVWSAILASILTHIAVFVPLLFLEGISSVMFRQLSVVVVFSLLMSLFVAVTLVPVLCSKLLVLPPPADQRKGLGGWLYSLSERALNGMDEGYRRLLHKALAHRPTVLAISAASVVAAIFVFPLLSTEFSTQADEGQVQVNVELAQGTRIEITGPVLDRVEAAINELVPEATSLIVNAGGGGRVRWARRWRTRRRRFGQSRQHSDPPRPEGRADAFERADRDRPPARAVRHSRRDHPRQSVRRQRPAQSISVGRRQQRRRPPLTRNPGRESRRSEAARAGHQGPAGHDSGYRRRPPRAR
jgi:multidrug efflux pump subunit AcrB